MRRPAREVGNGGNYELGRMEMGVGGGAGGSLGNM